MFDPSPIFDHSYHTVAVARQERLTGLHPPNRSCSYCHAGNLAKSAANAMDCLDCHREDMRANGSETLKANLMYASGYQQAMHDTCFECHKQEAGSSDRATLSECYTCHESLKPRLGTVKAACIAAEDKEEVITIQSAHAP
jgi:hypothetical protein